MSQTDDMFPDICVVTHPLSAAGENATRSLLEILASLTGVVLVTADLPTDSEIRNSREVIDLTRKGAGNSVPVAATRFVANQVRMARVVRQRPEEIVLFFGATAYVLPILVARLAGKTVVVEPRGDVPLTLRLDWERAVPWPVARALAALVRFLERIGFRLAHAVVTYTPGVARQLDLDASSPSVLPLGARFVATDVFEVKKPHDERDSLVGFLGRLDEEKGIRELAAVARMLPDDVRFRFVGDGDLRGWLERELASEIEAGDVEVPGWVEHADVPAHLNDLKLLVLPSQPTEGLPTVVLEALACGTPVYASPVAGVPDVVQDAETGFLIADRDPQSISAGVAAILERDDLARISKNGRSLVENDYTFEAARDRYERILCRLTRERRR